MRIGTWIEGTIEAPNGEGLLRYLGLLLEGLVGADVQLTLVASPSSLPALTAFVRQLSPPAGLPGRKIVRGSGERQTPFGQVRRNLRCRHHTALALDRWHADLADCARRIPYPMQLTPGLRDHRITRPKVLGQLGCEPVRLGIVPAPQRTRTGPLPYSHTRHARSAHLAFAASRNAVRAEWLAPCSRNQSLP